MGGVQDTNGMLERKEKKTENKEREREREVLPEKRVCQ
jgi:hypothetical protein